MERKVGEIFEYNGEWYQCLKSPDGSCKHCDMNFGGKCPIPIKECVASARNDLSYVIFKKLERVGEPYEFDGHLFQSYLTFEVPIFTENYVTVKELGNNSKISIEIKQNKENMEEKKQKLDKLVDNYVACKIKYAEFDKEIKALYDIEESKPSLKPFSLEAAKQGKPVYTRDGRKARIICFDLKGDMCPIVAAVEENNMEVLYHYDTKGLNCYKKSEIDLMMLPEKKLMWVNIHKVFTGLFP